MSGALIGLAQRKFLEELFEEVFSTSRFTCLG
jgi:hypothetical protein